MVKFEREEQRPHPQGAGAVADLVAAVHGGERITFRRTAEAEASARYYAVRQMGDYVCVPRLLNRPDLGDQPRPKRKNFAYKSLESMWPIEIKFEDYDGARRLAPFYSGLSSSLFLVSDALLDLLRRFDPDGFEVAIPKMRDADGKEMKGYAVVMPTRVIDAVDIHRTTVVVEHHVRAPEAGPSYSLVRYPSGRVFKHDIAAPTFVEEYASGWFWRLDVIRAVADGGVRGLYIAHPYKRDLASEIRLPAEGDLRYPADW